jgi:hypothetical protein
VLFPAAALAAPAVQCRPDGTCDKLSADSPFQFTAAPNAGCTGLKNPLKWRFNPGDGSAATPDAIECKLRAGDTHSSNPVHYDECSFKHVPAVSGRFTTNICDGTATNLKATFEIADNGAGEPNQRSPGAGDKAEAKALPGLNFLPPDIWQLTLSQIGVALADHHYGNYYSQRNDVAVVFVDADNAPFFPIPDTIDEDDDIYVAVVDYVDRLDGAKVSIQRCNRTPIEPRIYGSGVAAAAAQVRSNGEQARKVGVVIRAFGKCAGSSSGGPQVLIDRAGKQNLTTVPINPLYRLSVGIAFGYDFTRTSTFAVRAPAGSSITRVSESKDVVGVVPMVYVGFYPWARDFRKRDFFELQRAQLFVGMDTESFMDNIVVGAGYELTMGLNLMAGWRVLRKKAVLAEGSDLRVGSVFDGTTDSLPTRDKWDFGSAFVGFGLSSDLFARLK